MAGRAGAPASGSRRRKKHQQEPWPEEISLNQYALVRTYLLKSIIGIGYLALTWSTVVLLGGFVTVLGNKDFWCLTFISMMQAAGIFNDWGEGVMSYCFWEWAPITWKVVHYVRRTIDTFLLKSKYAWIYKLPVAVARYLFFSIDYLVHVVVGIVVWAIYQFGPLFSAGISLWRVIQHDYGSMDDTKANLMPALDLFYSLIICHGALSLLWWASHYSVLTNLFPKMWGESETLVGWYLIGKYLVDNQSKCWKDPKSINDRRLVNYAVDLLDSESSQKDYLSGAKMLNVLIKRGVDARPLILSSSQKVQKLMDTLRWSSSDREIKELAARILAHLACDIDLTQFPGALRCISSLLGTTQLPYWNSPQQGCSNQSPQIKLDQQRAGDQQGSRPQSLVGQLLEKIQKCKLCQQYAKKRRCKLDQQVAGDSELGNHSTTLPYWNSQQGSSNQSSPQSKLRQLYAKINKWILPHMRHPSYRKGQLDQQGARDSNELILQGLTILERLASDQHNCRDICSTPDLIAMIMSPINSHTLIQDINIMPWQDVVNGALRVVYRLIRAPEWTGGTRLAHDISSSKQALSNLERILDQGNPSSQQLQIRAMEILTELALDTSANLAMETKENLMNKQVHMFLDEGREEDHRVNAGQTLLALLSKTGNISMVCIMSEYNHGIVDQVTQILDAKNKVIYRTIASEILENLCALHTMDKNHVKNTLLPKVLAEVLTSKKKAPTEAPECHISKASGDIEESPLQDDEENQRLEHNGQINSLEQNEMQAAMMELNEALLSLTSVIFDKWIIGAEDFNDVARKVAPGEGEFVAKLKTIVEENYEATANSLRIVKLCGQIGVTMMRRSQYNTHFKDQKFVETLSKASKIMCYLESCMLFAGTDGGAKKTARPLLSDLVKEAEALVA